MPGLANLSKPFPGEVFSVNYNSGSNVNADYRQARNYFGANELGHSDNFSPFVAANYTSTKLPGLTAGTWASTTDDGLNVVSCSTGSGAVLVSKMGAAAQDKRDTYYIEISGRLNPSASGGNNDGKFGVGLSASNADCNNSSVAYVTAKTSGSGNIDLDVTATTYVGGSLNATQTASSALTTTADPEGFVPITIGLLLFVGWSDLSGAGLGGTVIVNGKNIFAGGSTGLVADFGSKINNYPFLFFGTPAAGTATAYETNLVQMIRYTDDLHPGTAVVKSGTIGSPTHSLPHLSDASPTFLEVWTRVANREGWYWRWTPQPYVLGTRTLGTIDMTTDPGTDRSASIRFSRPDGNLIELQLSANADQFVTGTTAAGPTGTDGGGLAYWRDIGSMTKYGVIEDQVLTVTAPSFNEQRKGALNISNNRVNLSAAGAKTAVVLRDAQTADKWRELDRVTIHDPELGINYQTARVVGYTFDEGHATQTIYLDQFSVDDPTVPIKRLQQGAFQIAAKFNNR